MFNWSISYFFWCNVFSISVAPCEEQNVRDIPLIYGRDLLQLCHLSESLPSLGRAGEWARQGEAEREGLFIFFSVPLKLSATQPSLAHPRKKGAVRCRVNSINTVRASPCPRSWVHVPLPCSMFHDNKVRRAAEVIPSSCFLCWGFAGFEHHLSIRPPMYTGAIYQAWGSQLPAHRAGRLLRARDNGSRFFTLCHRECLIWLSPRPSLC